MDDHIWDRIDKLVVANNLGDLERTDYHQVMELEFSNDPSVVASDMNDFIAFCSQSFDVKAVYLEMNGFYINPDRWFYDSFGYSSNATFSAISHLLHLLYRRYI